MVTLLRRLEEFLLAGHQSLVQYSKIDDNYHWAEAYLDRGYSVIPLNGKVPAIQWTKYQRQRPTRHQLGQWFGKNDGNIGIITGALSNLVVVDCDSVLDALWWTKNYPLTPLVVRTGKGAHFYYQFARDKQLGNRTKVLNHNIDIRAEGGQVVAPPSVHLQTGRRYLWFVQESYSLDAIPFFSPSWITNSVVVASQSKTVSSQSRVASTRIGHLQSYIRHIFAVSGECGHNSTFRVACLLRENGIALDEALPLMLEWNDTNAQPKWSLKELQHKLDDAYAKPG